MRLAMIALAVVFAGGLLSITPCGEGCEGCEGAEEAGAGHADEGDGEHECPPGCDDGCSCCARVVAAAESLARTTDAERATRRVRYTLHVDAEPTVPEPRDLEAVPRDLRA